ncbi:hypothetical protein O181_012156 [Austropuccinia psidii MF-1]|uniref:Reverse transcriptase domain-containing protein n=1 Tax=Austropuccinia psidii MF-1 TaxID=1389203 RepID=A0A9Q3BU49_9BASI|nr:hypothetical protein [Austropuccinia psidii MF-1]
MALLNTITKLFKRIINTRLSHWAHLKGKIALSHFGGLPGRNIEEAMILLDSWIKNKWKEKKVVTGLFLDVKSIYPEVHKARLIDSLRKKENPNYLVVIIESFPTNRETQIRKDGSTSKLKPIERGLPQGSPFSLTLYLIYNSSLLLPDQIRASSNQISIGYIDNITHLVAAKIKESALERLLEVSKQTLTWGRREGS